MNRLVRSPLAPLTRAAVAWSSQPSAGRLDRDVHQLDRIWRRSGRILPLSRTLWSTLGTESIGSRPSCFADQAKGIVQPAYHWAR